MAAGRGEFFQTLLEGVERAVTQGTVGRRPPFRGRRQSGSDGGRPGGWRKKRLPKAAPRAVSGNDVSWPEPNTDSKEADFPGAPASPSGDDFLERLPYEILIKILSYVDASSLFSVSHVNKLFHRLANDDVLWHKIYASEFGCHTWKPKSADKAELKAQPEAAAGRSVGHWKRMYFRSMAGQEMNKWRRELRNISPNTGLPKQTEWILRNLNVSWELTMRDVFGREHMLEQSHAYFFESSVIVCWSCYSFHRYHLLSSVQLHGVRKETPKTSKARRPSWRSLLLKLEVKPHPDQLVGKDKLIKLMHVSPGFLIGVWRSQSCVAFIMASLHFHRLVERILLGSPVWPYSGPVDCPLVDKSDPEFGLRGYMLHFVLHNTCTEIMSGRFSQLSCHTDQAHSGTVELRVINWTNLSQHRSLSGNIKLPWKSDSLEGSVENCCIISLTLLDEFQKPFWCVSSPICIKMAMKRSLCDYSGEHFVMKYKDPEGKVVMKLVWLNEQKQFFLISLIIYVPVSKVNKHFGTDY